MTTFADSLKREIARVSRKELREEITALRKSAVLHRAEISLLKKQLKSLQSDVRKLSSVRSLRNSAERLGAVIPADTPVKGRPGRKVLLTAERLKAQRTRLGFTQEQMAKLLGVSSLSVWKWESGAAVPRASRVPELLRQISLGKREALAVVNGETS